VSDSRRKGAGKRIGRIVELKKVKGLSASVYALITDVETNGLMTYDRKVVKIAPARLYRVNRRCLPHCREPVEPFVPSL